MKEWGAWLPGDWREERDLVGGEGIAVLVGEERATHIEITSIKQGLSEGEVEESGVEKTQLGERWGEEGGSLNIPSREPGERESGSIRGIKKWGRESTVGYGEVLKDSRRWGY